MSDQPPENSPRRRSSFAAIKSRNKQSWPNGRDFRVLSLDGGGVRGTFTAAFLAELEKRSGTQACDLFDLIVGTSTGGILAIGLADGHSAAKLEKLYTEKGQEIFPRAPVPLSWMWKGARCLFARYDSERLRALLIETLGADRKLGDINQTRLCIQAFDAIHGDVFVFKTPHHPDYHLDAGKHLVDIALATSAAPTYFLPQATEEGYILGDGGIWANNPVLVGIVEVCSAFDVPLNRIRVVSVGCGNSYRPIGFWRRQLGGLLPWASIIHTAVHLQSLSAMGQAKHLVGPENIVRVDVLDPSAAAINLDDVVRAVRDLPPLGKAAADDHWEAIASLLGI